MNLVQELCAMAANLKILYVEDDEALQKQMTGMFKEFFNEVDTAYNGAEALQMYKEYYEKNAQYYDLVVTDINMPKMNGLELIKAIHLLAPSQAIIVSSAYNETDYLMELLDIGVNSFILKPVSYNILLNVLYKVVKEIDNERLVQYHYEEIAKLNDQLLLQAQELEKSNNELSMKNLALEKSMRIIEGLHHKNQLHTKMTLPQNIMPKPLNPEHVESPPSLVCEIEKIIHTIALKLPCESIDEQQLQALSKAVKTYAGSLHENEEYKGLSEAFESLAQRFSHQPKATTASDIEKVMNLVESFFFIYKKWEKEWKNIRQEDFKLLSASMVDEIKTLLVVWNNPKA